MPPTWPDWEIWTLNTFLLVLCPKEAFCVLFKEKGTYYHDKGGLAGPPLVWRFVPRRMMSAGGKV